MTDHLSITFQCDFCGCIKELRYFESVADGGIMQVSICKDCHAFNQEQDKHEIFAKALGKVQIEEVISELKRELAVRRRVYPDWIKSGKIKQSCADYRILVLTAGIEFLLFVQQQTSSQRRLF